MVQSLAFSRTGEVKSPYRGDALPPQGRSDIGGVAGIWYNTEVET